MSLKVIGIGEMLWDMFPEGRRPGGAPFNFAWHARLLGADAGIITRVGRDRLGDELVAVAGEAGFDLSLIQRDTEHPTGTVRVTLNRGEPAYIIETGVAWDCIEADGVARAAVRAADAVCFGTLASRSAASARAIAELVAAADQAKIIFDVNLRQNFWTNELLAASMAAADVVKVNSAELKTVAGMLSLADPRAHGLLSAYDLELVVETLGAEGCVVHSADGPVHVPGLKVLTVDTVGSGDAFTAALAVSLARGDSVIGAAMRANIVGAFVATQHGATPRYTLEQLVDFSAGTECRGTWPQR